MSGICGVVNYSGSDPVTREVLEGMLAAISHRGPDEKKFFVSPDRRAGIAANRVSIVGTESWKQPFVGEDGSAVVLDGIITNAADLRRDLRDRGVECSSGPDAEVVLACRRAYGEDFPEKLEGEFALVVIDREGDRVFLVRDHCGIKPLYYRATGGRLLFASEIKSLLAHPDVSAEIDEEAVYHFLTFGASPAPFTLFRNIRKVPAGSMVCYAGGGRTDKHYWHPMSVPVDEKRGKAGLLEIMERLVPESVKACMSTDAPRGVYLSGGLDSNLVLAEMRRAFSGEIHSFTLGFSRESADRNELDEAGEAEKAARRFETLHRTVRFEPSQFRHYHTEVARRADDPYCASQNALMYRLAIEAAEAGVPLVLTGEAADALFLSSTLLSLAEFARNKADRLARLPRWMLALMAGTYAAKTAIGGRLCVSGFRMEALRSMARGERFFWGSAFILGEKFKRGLLSTDYAARCRGLRSHDIVEDLWGQILSRRPDADPVHLLAWVNFGVWISEQGLHSYEGQSAAHGVVARVPFLNRRLVEAVFSTPADVLVGDGGEKAVLKEYSERLLPKEVIYKKKLGFSSPMERWWRENLPDWLEELMDRGGVEWTRFFRIDMLRRILRVHRSRRQNLTWQIMHLINFALWHMFWIEGVDE